MLLLGRTLLSDGFTCALKELNPKPKSQTLETSPSAEEAFVVVVVVVADVVRAGRCFFFVTLFLNLIPIIVKLFKKTISIFKGLGFGLGKMVFLWGCGCMGFSVGFFYVVVYGCFWWFHLVGIGYRLLWFWVFKWVFPRVLPMGLEWVEG